MPTSLSRLSSCLSSILSFLECPICFDIISPPAHQCPLGHLICFRCRVYIERCPVCRTGFTRERSLLADQIYNSVIEAFHLKNQNSNDRTKKLWERVFGRRKRNKMSDFQSASSTPKISRASDIKNKFLTRLIGKSSSVDNLASESNFTPNLRKKSISSTDIYPESQRKLHNLHRSYQYSTESLPNQENDTLSAYSSTNSCEALGNRNIQYYNRLRHRNIKENAENLFQFSSVTAENETNNNNLYHCPLSETCVPVTAFSLLTHLQLHDGPVIQYFKHVFSIHFPFSFDNGALFIVHCYEKTFFVRLHNAEDTGDVKLYVWLMGTKAEAEGFKLKVNLRSTDYRTDLKYKTVVSSIESIESPYEIYRHQIVITNSTLEIYFQDRFYSFDLHFKKVNM